MLCFVIINSILVNLLCVLILTITSVWIFIITVLHCVHNYCWLLSGSSLLLLYTVSILLASVWLFTTTVLHCVHIVGFCLVCPSAIPRRCSSRTKRRTSVASTTGSWTTSSRPMRTDTTCPGSWPWDTAPCTAPTTTATTALDCRFVAGSEPGEGHV